MSIITVKHKRSIITPQIRNINKTHTIFNNGHE